MASNTLPTQLARMATSRMAQLDFVLSPVTPLPEDILRRFPDMKRWYEAEEARRVNLERVLRELVTSVREATLE